jgi:hypothetical protein
LNSTASAVNGKKNKGVKKTIPVMQADIILSKIIAVLAIIQKQKIIFLLFSYSI